MMTLPPIESADVGSLSPCTSAGGAPTDEAVSWRRLPILLVGRPPLLSALRRRLTTSGFAVDCATSGDAAWSLLRVRDYALLAVDLVEPGADGAALVNRVRGDSQLCDQLTVLLTTRAAAEPAHAATRRCIRERPTAGHAELDVVVRTIGELLAPP
jgi:CheY-like chemotaxis protein